MVIGADVTSSEEWVLAEAPVFDGTGQACWIKRNCAPLVLQGLTMPMLIRMLGFEGRISSADEEEVWARRRVLESALGQLTRLREESDGRHLEVFDRLEEYYRRRLLLLDSKDRETDLYVKAAQELRDLERKVAHTLRAENKIHDEVLRKLERELDLVDARFEN